MPLRGAGCVPDSANVRFHMNDLLSDPPSESPPARWPVVMLVLVGLVLSTGIVFFIGVLGGGAAANVAHATFFSRYFAHLCIGVYVLYVLAIFLLFSKGRHTISAAVAWLPFALAATVPAWLPPLLRVGQAFTR
jgi:hypothetical protein